MRVVVATPAPRGSRVGNRTTALRWARILRALGHRVLVTREWVGQPCDVLIALHARKSSAAVERFRSAHPEKLLIVALTGTDLYGGLHNPAARRSIDLADRLVVLHRLALDALPQAVRSKTRVIFQSADRTKETLSRSTRHFVVCVLGHLRPIKDPFRAALASRLLPAESRIRILQLGAAMSSSIEKRARDEERLNPRYRWLGDRARAEALRILGRSHVMVISSRSEGGANVVSEALAAGVPILASRIPASVDLLGDDYPGTFEVGDTRGLARLPARAEGDPSFRSRLIACCRKRVHWTDPAREARAWKTLLA